jgi:hypothetical protein
LILNRSNLHPSNGLDRLVNLSNAHHSPCCSVGSIPHIEKLIGVELTDKGASCGDGRRERVGAIYIHLQINGMIRSRLPTPQHPTLGKCGPVFFINSWSGFWSVANLS